MSVACQPTECPTEACLPEPRIIRSALAPRDREFHPFVPSLAAKDGSQISMIRLIALIDPDRSVIKAQADAAWQGGPAFKLQKVPPALSVSVADVIIEPYHSAALSPISSDYAR